MEYHSQLDKWHRANIFSRVYEAVTKEKAISFFFYEPNSSFHVVFERTVMSRQWKKRSDMKHMGDFYRGSMPKHHLEAILKRVNESLPKNVNVLH